MTQQYYKIFIDTEDDGTYESIRTLSEREKFLISFGEIECSFGYGSHIHYLRDDRTSEWVWNGYGLIYELPEITGYEETNINEEINAKPVNIVLDMLDDVYGDFCTDYDEKGISIQKIKKYSTMWIAVDEKEILKIRYTHATKEVSDGKQKICLYCEDGGIIRKWYESESNDDTDEIFIKLQVTQ